MKFDIIKCELFGGDSNVAILARVHDEESDGPGERVRIDIPDFEPYFYIPLEETETARELMEEQVEDIKGRAREVAESTDGELSVEEAEDIIEEERDIVDIIEGFEEIDGRPVTKVVTDHPRTVPQLRDEFSETWESDIPFEMRFRVDADIKQVFEVPDMCLQEIGENRYKTTWTLIEPCPEDEAINDPRNFYFDIEVGGEEQKVPEDDNLNPISCITGFDSYTEKLISWVWRDDYDRETEETTYTYNSSEHDITDPDDVLEVVNGVWRKVAEAQQSDDTILTDEEVEMLDSGGEIEDPDTFKQIVMNHLSPDEEDIFRDAYQSAIEGWNGEEFYSLLFSVQDNLEEMEVEEVNFSFDWEIRRFNGESDMMVNFFNYFREEDIDVLSGWYSDKFDVPYVIERCRDVGVDPSIWSDFGEVDPGLPIDSYGQAEIGGLFLNDLERRYDNLEGPSSTALDSVARNEIGMEWEQESGNIQELWDNNPQEMLQYNANDVVATAQIDFVAGVTDFFIQKMYMTGTRVEEIEQDSNVITYYCMYEANDDEIIPRGTSHTHKEFGGGRVLIPDRPGILENIAVLDLSKIYPSIMISLNLSYETSCGVDPVHLHESLNLKDRIPRNAWENLDDEISERGSVYDEEKGNDKLYYLVDWDFGPGDVVSPLNLGKKGRKEIFDTLYDMESDASLTKTMDWEFQTPDVERGTQLPNGVRIDMEKNGLITRILREMFELRWHFGDQMDALDPKDPNYKLKYDRLYNRRQNMKDNINAVFGYMGYKKSPLFRPEIAMTVTFIGRNVLRMCEVVTDEELGYEVVYGDTDSIFVELDGLDWENDKKEAIYESYRIGEFVNARMDDFAQNFCGIEDHMFEIEFEKFYPMMFIGDQKKRYAGRRSYAV